MTWNGCSRPFGSDDRPIRERDQKARLKQAVRHCEILRARVGVTTGWPCLALFNSLIVGPPVVANQPAATLCQRGISVGKAASCGKDKNHSRGESA
jgi:hypothetical protein